MEFVASCMVGAEKAAFLKAVKSHVGGGKSGAKKFGALINAGVNVVDSDGSFCESILCLLEGFDLRDDTQLFRREMFYAMRSALRMASSKSIDLKDAIWNVQNRLRHAGRDIPKRCVGSTLLVKGLEFDHAVVIQTDRMSRNDWYVALTRATTGLTILSPTEHISPKA